MRRYLFIILFFLVLVTPFVLRALMGKTSTATRGASDDTLIIITPHSEGIRREFKDAFTPWHLRKYGKPAFVDYRTFGAADIVKFFEDASRAGAPYNIDLAWGGGDFLFDQQLKRPGYLQPALLDPSIMSAAFPKPDINGVPLYDSKDNPPFWLGTCLSSFGILYNRDVLRYLQLPEPTTWRDLENPKYATWVIAADPTRSSTAKIMFLIIVERAMADAAAAGRSEDEGWAEGMGHVRLIAANARLFSGSSEAVPAIVSSGDGAAGMAIDYYGRSQVESIGPRLNYIEPRGATAINPDPIALVKGAPHKELALHFIEFVLSEDGQKLWNTKPGAPGGPHETSLRRLPIVPSVYQHAENFVDKVNPFQMSLGFNKSDAREKTFNIVGELIEFSCIDLLDELRATRAAILASPRAAELDAKLGRFPFDQKEALRRMAQWRAGSAAERLTLQRQWTREFRDEYRKLRKEAAK